MPIRTQYQYLFISVIALAAIALFAAGCDNPVEPDGHNHVEEIEGVVLSTTAGEIARAEGGSTNDTLWVPLGDTTAEITVEFIDPDGHEIHLEELEEAFELGWTIGDADIVEFIPQGAWSFTLEGLVSDTTMLKIELLHLPQGHPDFTVPDIPVVVR